MKKTAAGWSMIAGGLIAAGAAYAFRPPSNFSEALIMASQGREIYLQPPVYIGVLIVGALLVAGGIWLLRSAAKNK